MTGSHTHAMHVRKHVVNAMQGTRPVLQKVKVPIEPTSARRGERLVRLDDIGGFASNTS